MQLHVTYHVQPSASIASSERPPASWAVLNSVAKQLRSQMLANAYLFLCLARNAFAQPARVSCRPRATARASGSTFLVMTEPDPT